MASLILLAHSDISEALRNIGLLQSKIACRLSTYQFCEVWKSSLPCQLRAPGLICMHAADSGGTVLERNLIEATIEGAK
jgi:hypothetical protein